ncbi:MAG: ribonuclease P protein component [Pseudomonadota bacterium]
MTKRRDFLACARARRQSVPGLLLQARRRQAHEVSDDRPRIGFTCSKKIGNAVTRNRAKRRLRAAAALLMPAVARPGFDYVLIGRPAATVSRPFDALLGDLRNAFERIHAAGKRPADGGPANDGASI